MQIHPEKNEILQFNILQFKNKGDKRRRKKKQHFTRYKNSFIALFYSFDVACTNCLFKCIKQLTETVRKTKYTINTTCIV